MKVSLQIIIHINLLNILCSFKNRNGKSIKAQKKKFEMKLFLAFFMTNYGNS